MVICAGVKGRPVPLYGSAPCKEVKDMRRMAMLAAALFIFALGCATVPYTERQQIMMISEDEEAKLGQAAFTQVKAESKVSGDPRANELVRRVGSRVAAAADKPEYQWEFAVFEDKSVNAFALPGGKVVVNTGILPVTADETGLAVVIGHEVAHVLARHGAERLSQQQLLSIGQVALLAGLMGSNPAARETVMQAYGLGAQVGVLLPYSRKHETEADKIGLILMAKAGYDPRAAVAFWKRMMEAGKGKGAPELLSTHPSDETRIAALEEFMPIAMDYYNESAMHAPAR